MSRPMSKFCRLFKKANGVVVGMCHVQALPGCPKNALSLSKITDIALREAEVYLSAGIDGIMIENMHDVPYVKGKDIGPEIVAGMTRVGTVLRKTFPTTPIGIQILTAGNKEALAVAKCADLNFVRCEGFVFSHIGDEGWIDSSAGTLLRYRKMIGAEDVLVLTDIKKKHSSHQVTSDITVAEAAKAAEFFLSDGVIVTGNVTGQSPDERDLVSTKQAVKLPVLVGSGIDEDNATDYLKIASGVIVGSYFKQGSNWTNDVDHERVNTFMNKVMQ